jgi:glycosyltransferase involved in cell wall biosynthesis
MRAADAFVLSSRWEGPGHVLIEALALGTPAVTTDCPVGPREIVRGGEAGLLVPVGNPGAMAERITKLLQNETLRRQFAVRGPEVVSKFGVEEASKKYVDFVESVS